MRGSLLGMMFVILFITGCGVCSKSNVSPVADAGAAQTVNEQTEISLLGSGEDSDGSIVSYSWVQTGGTDVELVNAETINATFQSPETTEQLTLTFELTVTDNEGATNTDTAIIDIMSVISGLVVDDLLINANVKLLTFPEQQLIVETQTDNEGRYSFQQASLQNYIIIEVTGGTLNGQEFVGTLTGFYLITERLSCHITPISTLIKSYAEQMNIVAGADKAAWIEQLVDVLMIDLTTDPFIDETNTDVQIEKVRSFLQNGERLDNWSSAVLSFIQTGVVTKNLQSWFPNTNLSPVASAGSNQSVNEQTTVTLSGSGSDSDGYIVSYSWQQTQGKEVDPKSRTIFF